MVAAVALALGSMGWPTVGVKAVGVSGASADVDPAISPELAFRVAFGLRTDATYVKSVAMSGSYNTDWGVPLTDDEAKDISNRARIAREKAALHKVVDDAANYAGLYTDQTRGGLIVVRLTSEDSSLTALIRDSMPTGAKWEIEDADYSWAVLNNDFAQVQASYDDLTRRGFHLASVGVDPVRNRVVIGLDPFDQAAADYLLSEFGPTVVAEAERTAIAAACADRERCTDPYRAGTHIRYSDPYKSVDCTSGFMSRPVSGAVAGEWYMMTAGHCIRAAGGANMVWYQGTGPRIGPATNHWTFSSGAGFDAGIIKVDAIDFPTNWAYGNTSQDTITGGIAGSSQDVGDPVCRAGWYFWVISGVGYQCNTVTDQNRDVNVLWHGGYYLIHHQWAGGLTSREGDSGGPVMNGHFAMGITSSSSSAPNKTWYSPIDYIISGTGYRPCYTSNSNPCG